MTDRIRPRSSLLYRVLLVTSAATVLLFSATAYLIASYAIRDTESSIQEEVRASLREFDLVWRTRADTLARISRLFSAMAEVRGAFQTGDVATIRDTAAELWSRVSHGDAVFLVFDPRGAAIASLGGDPARFQSIGRVIPDVRASFPEQKAGFLVEGDQLFYVILTPVYVGVGSDSALLNVLATGFAIDNRFAKSLQQATAGTDFQFRIGSQIIASTLSVGRNERYATLTDPLMDLYHRPVGTLSVMRSLAGPDARLRDLKQSIAVILVIAILTAILVSLLLARQILGPIAELDRAASEVSARNYSYRLNIRRNDELGRLAETFNQMCDSIQEGRQELIAQERLNTIGRLSSSLVHDLRNPLAAIYGGAEMLVDGETLPPQQARRLANTIYRASRHIQEMLKSLLDSSRGRAETVEVCRLFDVIDSARSLLATTVEAQKTPIEIDVAEELELPLERSRMERVFLNLLNNALEATRDGGVISIRAFAKGESYVVEIDDTGLGVPDAVLSQLFLPFFSHGKRNGLGLGLALSRQAALDHGGDLWLAKKDGAGARFCLRLPAARK